MAKSYVLGHSDKEQERLDEQAQHLVDPFLEPLLKGARRCLEIGCGVGSNIPWIHGVNPKLEYHGVDISADAIDSARKRFGTERRVTLTAVDGTKLPYAAGEFDLVFTKLVMWAAGVKAPAIAKEALRVLKPGGLFHSFEPEDDMLIFFPHKPALEKVLASWQAKTKREGMNPCIGKELAPLFHSAGFRDITHRAYARTAQGDSAIYRTLTSNIRRIYFGQDPKGLGLKATSPAWKNGLKELSQVGPRHFMVDTYFAVTGRKP